MHENCEFMCTFIDCGTFCIMLAFPIIDFYSPITLMIPTLDGPFIHQKYKIYTKSITMKENNIITVF